MLERAAVIGKDFWPGAVAALGEGEETLGATLLELVRRELLEPAASMIPGEDGFSFRHALIRDAAYGATPLRRRAAHHERFAEWLAAGGFGEEYDEIRGYHLEQAVRLRRELGPDDESRPGARRRGVRAARRVPVVAPTRAAMHRRRATSSSGHSRSTAATSNCAGFSRNTLGSRGAGRALLELLHAVAADAVAAGDRAQEWYARLDAASSRRADHGLLETAAQAVEVFSELDDERGLSEAWRRIGAGRVRPL